MYIRRGGEFYENCVVRYNGYCVKSEFNAKSLYFVDV